MRTTITIELEDARVSRLDAWANSETVSRAEAVRRAVNQMLERSAAPQGSGFGLWTQGKAVGSKVFADHDGLAMQRAMRGEWPD